MPVPEHLGTANPGDIVNITITGRVVGVTNYGIYLGHLGGCNSLGSIPYEVMVGISPSLPLPDVAHTFEAGDLVASDCDLPRPYVRTRQADGSWLTPKGFRSSVTDAYMSARIEAGDFWRVDASNPDTAVEYALTDAPRLLIDESCSYKSTCGPVSGGRLTMTSGSRGDRPVADEPLADWERELLSSPALVTLPEVDATPPRFKVGALYYHPTYPTVLYTREAGGWRSHEHRFSPIPRLLPDDSPYLTSSWVDGLMQATS